MIKEYQSFRQVQSVFGRKEDLHTASGGTEMRTCFVVASLVLAFINFTFAAEEPRVVMLKGGMTKGFPKALQNRMHDRLRSGYTVNDVSVSTSNTWLGKIVVWGEGKVTVKRLELIAVDAQGVKSIMHSQTWAKDTPTCGGNWTYTNKAWFAQAIKIGKNMPIFTKNKDGSVVLDTTGRPSEVHCLWFSTWPHPTIPAGTVKVGIRAVYQVHGEAKVHFGLDRYAHNNVTKPVSHGPNQNLWEMAMSPTFTLEHNGKGGKGIQDRTYMCAIRLE